MLRFLVIAPLLAVPLLPVAALAQEVPAEAQMDMWCGTAFELMTRDAPADATPEKLASAKVYADGGALLLQRAIPIYLEAGYTDDALADYRGDLEDSIGRVVNGTGRASDGAAYSFQDCSALIGQ
ncbi:hypothetical protein ASC89_02210 [Devosia sp. Root413D1]|uniref:hypothetical protein n=1 Tax=unclassified Devosia TaxID=196773 RepID=UPI0006F9700D|nr:MULTISPECIES: hypothetical protein [unclassified Devosia]KQV09263.1 hypothetical protein ASC68_02860 [Devosia sp. Root105]KQW85902.1 hypothetical protein ASC89_02210 [Devosia sp. Root413D1]